MRESRSSNRWRLAGVLALLIAHLSGCGGTSPAGGSSSAEAWVGWDGESALLVRWTEDAGGSLSGVMQLAMLEDGGAAVESQTWTVSGVRAGSGVTLSLQVPLAPDVAVVGEVDGDRLTLYWPSRGGELDPLVLKVGNVGLFNQRVGELEAAAAEVAAAQARERAATDAVEEARRQLESARWHLEARIGDLEVALGEARRWLQQAEVGLEQLRYRVEQVHGRVASAPELVTGEVELAVGQWEVLAADLEALRGPTTDWVTDASEELDLAVGGLEAAIRRRIEVEEYYYEVMVPLEFPDEQQLIIDAEAQLQSAPGTLNEILETAASVEADGDALLAEAQSLLPSAP